MHWKRRFKICLCSVILGKLESYLIAAGWPLSLLLNRTETLATQASNKVVIGLRVVQFWSQIILVISDRTRAEITRMILNQIALYSVQLHYKCIVITFSGIQSTFRSLEMHCKRCFKICICSVIPGKLESHLIAAGWPLKVQASFLINLICPEK